MLLNDELHSENEHEFGNVVWVLINVVVSHDLKRFYVLRQVSLVGLYCDCQFELNVAVMHKGIRE